MQQKCIKLALASLLVVTLGGCGGAAFHEDAGKRLENGSPPDLPGAIAEYKQAVEADKINTEYKYDLANAYYKNGEYKPADEQMREAH